MSLIDFLAVLSNSVVFVLWAWAEILYFLFRRGPDPVIPDWGAGVPVNARRWYITDKFVLSEESTR